MHLKILKFLKKKKIFYKLQIIYSIYLFIIIRYFRFFFLKQKINFFFLFLTVFNQKLICYQRCLLSQKSRNIYKFINLSRFRIKEYTSLGLIPNLKKYSW